VAAAGGCAAIVAGALVVANVNHAGQLVTIRPAAHGNGATVFVADYDNSDITAYSLGEVGNPGSPSLTG